MDCACTEFIYYLCFFFVHYLSKVNILFSGNEILAAKTDDIVTRYMSDAADGDTRLALSVRT